MPARTATRYTILQDKGKVSRRAAEEKAHAEYDAFNKTQKIVSDFTVRPLRVQLFKAGRCVYKSPAIREIRDYCQSELDTLWDQIKRFENPQTYYVDLSLKLWNCKNELLASCRI